MGKGRRASAKSGRDRERETAAVWGLLPGAGVPRRPPCGQHGRLSPAVLGLLGQTPGPGGCQPETEGRRDEGGSFNPSHLQPPAEPERGDGEEEDGGGGGGVRRQRNKERSGEGGGGRTRRVGGRMGRKTRRKRPGRQLPAAPPGPGTALCRDPRLPGGSWGPIAHRPGSRGARAASQHHPPAPPGGLDRSEAGRSLSIGSCVVFLLGLGQFLFPHTLGVSYSPVKISLFPLTQDDNHPRPPAARVVTLAGDRKAPPGPAPHGRCQQTPCKGDTRWDPRTSLSPALRGVRRTPPQLWVSVPWYEQHKTSLEESITKCNSYPRALREQR